MKFNNDWTISIEYNTFIQLNSNILDICYIVDLYDDDVTNESITSRMEWFTKLWGVILGIKYFWILKWIEVVF